MALSLEDKLFFRHHKIDESLLFDANGSEHTQEIEDSMKRQNKAFAFNTALCTNGGHTLKARSGHCIQCNTARIKFMLDHIACGAVYIAGSIAGQMIKIGFTENIESRRKKLNTTKYGSQSDWEILYYATCINGGYTERLIQSALSRYAVIEAYHHDGHTQKANELFKCSYQKAKEALVLVQSTNKIEFHDPTERNLIIHKYAFRNLARIKK